MVANFQEFKGLCQHWVEENFYFESRENHHSSSIGYPQKAG